MTNGGGVLLLCTICENYWERRRSKEIMKGLVIRKVATLLLAASMLSGLLLPAVGTINVYADTNTTSAPSITAYASKSDLKDKFAPDSGNIGKLKFGKNSNSKVQEWYILGSDSGVNGDNTAIFAASNMTGNVIFQMNSEYDSAVRGYINKSGRNIGSTEVKYEGSPSLKNFYINHYGLSDARNTLREMATASNTSYFTPKEQELMNKTTVSTEDLLNKDGDSNPRSYTTSDKLYLPYGSYNPGNQIYIGSSDSKKVDNSKYWATGDCFWLRTPASGNGGILELCANPVKGNKLFIDVRSDYGGRSDGLRPASNLNLSSVLFASAAVAASLDASETGSIPEGTAMTLRLDGTGKNIGLVKATTDAITVTKGSSQIVALVVQGTGKDSNQEIDWYYSTAITGTGTTTIDKDTIETKLQQEVQLKDDINLKSCKIWLEITDDEDGMIYAVNSSFHQHNYDGSEWEKDDPTYHYKLCTPADACPYEDKGRDYEEAHTFNEDGYCTVCGYDAGNYFEYNEELIKTCKDKGREEFWTYTVDGNPTLYRFSGEYDTPAVGVKLKKLEKFTSMDKIITDYDPDNHVDQSNNKPYAKEYVKVDASTHKILCSGCEAEIGTASHNFSGNKCVDCGYTKSSNSSGGSGGSSNTSTGWIKDSKGWKYRNSDGIIAQGSTVTDKDGNKVEKVLWQKAGNGYYAFGSDGYLVTGWIYDKLDDKWYYCDENNGKLYGWFNEVQDGYWYYLSPSTGEAMTGWQNVNGKDYYLSGEPSAPTYSFDASTGFWIYSNIYSLRPFGSMYANTVTPDNYQVDANGSWIH